MRTIKVTDDTSRAELAEALANVNNLAKRLPHIYGGKLPTEWDRRHATLDALLTDWQDAVEVDG